ncbi:MAG: hypothetical protein ABH811_01325 [archaeon]
MCIICCAVDLDEDNQGNWIEIKEDPDGWQYVVDYFVDGRISHSFCPTCGEEYKRKVLSEMYE